MRVTLSCLPLAGAFTAFAQNNSITGTVTDATGSLVPGAKVIATNSETGVATPTETTSTGNYTIPGVPVGVYTITTEKSGFKKSSQGNIQITVASTVRVDVRIELGAVSESVSITAESPLLKTESAEQSTVVATDRVNDLPLNFGGGGSSAGSRTCTNIAAGASSCNAGGTAPTGCGSINYTNITVQPRNGQLVGRFTF